MGDQCHGNGKVHCCWNAGRVCRFLRDDLKEVTAGRSDRRWICTIYEKYGSWDAAHASPEHTHLRTVEWKNTPLHNFKCGDWPQDMPPQGGGLCCFGDDPQCQNFLEEYRKGRIPRGNAT